MAIRVATFCADATSLARLRLIQESQMMEDAFSGPRHIEEGVRVAHAECLLAAELGVPPSVGRA